MEKVIYSKKGGLGIILQAGECEADFFEPKYLPIHDGCLKVGDFTTLFGFFNSLVRYVGVLKGEKNCMVFELGKEEDLTHYACVFWLSPYRIANKYAENTVRDFQWANGKWK